jgi:hypothetical protein
VCWVVLPCGLPFFANQARADSESLPAEFQVAIGTESEPLLHTAGNG